MRIIDGDTFVLLPEGFPTPVRLANADTPETGPRARCPEERALGERATTWCARRETRQVAVFPTWKLDKYRRALAYVTIDGEDLGGLLVREGLARRYHGEQRLGWCR